MTCQHKTEQVRKETDQRQDEEWAGVELEPEIMKIQYPLQEGVVQAVAVETRPAGGAKEMEIIAVEV